jgi:hypothetical protein
MKPLSSETGKRVLYSVVQSAGDPDQWRRLLRESELDATQGDSLLHKSRRGPLAY